MKKKLLLLCLFTSMLAVAQKRVIVMPDGHSLSLSVIKTDRSGNYVFTAEKQKCIMWDARTGRQLHTFRYTGGDNEIGMDISPDGRLIAIAAGGAIRLHSTVSGALIAVTKGYNDFTDVAFAPSGRQLYGADEGIKVLDAATLAISNHIKSEIDYKAKIWILPGGQVLLASSNKYEVLDIGASRRSFAHTLPNGDHYQNITFLPGQQQLVCWGNQSAIDFFDITTGTRRGSITRVAYDAAVIPSVNTDEVLVTGTKAGDGYIAMDLYSTDTYTAKGRFTNTSTIKYQAATSGWFDGLAKKSWFLTYNKASLYNLATKSQQLLLEGYIASVGFDTFNAMEYNYTTGRLHLNTDDEYLKTIDLTRMVPLLHTHLKLRPEGLSVSGTGDTAVIFEEGKMTLRNVAINKLLRPVAPVSNIGFLYRDWFFFDAGGKFFYYVLKIGSDERLLRMNTATGAAQTILTNNFSKKMKLHPDRTVAAGFESTGSSLNAAVWDLTNGKKMFTKAMDGYADADEQYAAIANNKEKVLVVRGNQLHVFDIAGNAVVTNKQITGLDKFGAAAASGNLSIFAIGNSLGELKVYDGNGDKKYELQAHNTIIRNILFSPDDKLLYTVSNDNTIKVWEAATGRAIGTLYMFKDSNDYVFMDADGRFDGTPEGMRKIYYLLNGKDLPLDKLFERYYTPNLFARRVANEAFATIDDNLKPAPKVRLHYAEGSRNLEVGDAVPAYTNTTGTAEIIVEADAGDDAVDEIRLFHNGKAITLTTRNLIVADDSRAATASKKYIVALLPGINSFRGIALNSQRTESDPDEMLVMYKTAVGNGNAPAPAVGKISTVASVDRSATLHLMVVGINAYKNPALSLNYALADATSFKDEIEKDAKSVLGQIKTYFVTDAAADKKGITAAMEEIKAAAKPQDVFIFYYAGHGVIAGDKEFYLVPNDVSDLKNATAELNQKGIAAKMLQQLAVDITAQKQLFILDACQSAGAFEEMLAAGSEQQKNIAVVARSTGTHWMAASGSQQYANEFAALGHGAFTYVLLQALKGSALQGNMITVNGLKAFLQTGVPELMKKYNGSAQYPASYGFGADFPVEIKR